MELVVQLDGEPVHLLFGNPVSPRTSSRAERRDDILGWIGAWSAERSDAVAVVGDLNATPWSAAFRSLLERGELVDSQRDHGLQASWPADAGRLGLPIDHLLHSRSLTTIERQLGPSFGSDHRMIHARIARNTVTEPS